MCVLQCQISLTAIAAAAVAATAQIAIRKIQCVFCIQMRMHTADDFFFLKQYLQAIKETWCSYQLDSINRKNLMNGSRLVLHIMNVCEKGIVCK